jgi:hypothetical protein
MKEFVMIFRLNDTVHASPSPEQIQERMNWLASVAAQNKLVDKGNTLSPVNGKTIKAGNVVSDGPYTEIKEFVSGYLIVRSETIDDAVELAKENPIFKIGGNVEIREVATPNIKSNPVNISQSI